jgi:amino acid transporter
MNSPLPGADRRRFSSFYVAMVAVAMVVGAGIFKSPAVVAGAAGSEFWLYAAWIIGGAISLLGALCYAEMSTAFPNAGGDYHYMRLSYGRSAAFLFAWARFSIINTGQIALLGFVLGVYVNEVVDLGPQGPAVYAALAIGALTLFTLRGVKSDARYDFALTGLEVAGVVVLIGAALWMIVSGAPPLTESQPIQSIDAPPESFGMALVFALLAYGGWSEVATLSAETRDAQRGMVRALIGAILLITTLYVAANWALLRGLGLEGLASSDAPAADLMRRAFGDAAGVIAAIAISLAVLTSINATILTGGRILYACAQDWPVMAPLARWDDERGAPAIATWAQSIMALGLVVLGAVYDGFETMVDLTSPVFWIFMVLTGSALIVLRMQYPLQTRVFRTPLYPLTPVLFVLASIFMVWSSVSYVWGVLQENLFTPGTESRPGAVFGLGLLALGFPILIWLSAREGARR